MSERSSERHRAPGNAKDSNFAGRLRPILDGLAGKAWPGTPDEQTGQFLLQPSDLAPGTSAESMHACLTALYGHARRWAPGLEIPFFVPPVQIGALDAAGYFRVDGESYASITVSAEYVGDAEAVLLILAHEACHDILRQSQLNRPEDVELDEITTDLAMFVCGFGEIVLRGHSRVGRGLDRSARVHLGYLSTAEYQDAQAHVGSRRATEGLPGRFDLAAMAAPEPKRPRLDAMTKRDGTVEVACAEAMCKRTFSATLRSGRTPWPIRCPACGVFLYPNDILQRAVISELEPHRAELRLPRNGQLVECTSAMLSALVPPDRAPAPASAAGSTLLDEMLEAASPAIDNPARSRGRQGMLPSSRRGSPASTGARRARLVALTLLIVVSLVVAWLVSRR